MLSTVGRVEAGTPGEVAVLLVEEGIGLDTSLLDTELEEGNVI